MSKKSILIFTLFTFAFLFLSLFFLDGGLFFVAMSTTSLYVLLSSIIIYFSNKLGYFMTGFLMSISCVTSPFILDKLLHLYSLCK